MIYRALPRVSGRKQLGDAGGAETSVASVGFIQFVYLYEVDRGDFLDDELGYAVAFIDLDVVGGIQVDEDNLEFSSVVGVDEARRVDYRQALLDGQAATGLDEAGVAIGQGDGQPGRDQTAFEGLQDAVLVGAQIQAGIGGMGVFGKLDGGIETLYVEGNVGHGITLACRALAETHRRL